MARDRGPSYVPATPPPDDGAPLEGEIVCCMGECRQVVELATTALSQQMGAQLTQIAVILSRILQPLQQTLLSQLQVAQTNVDRVTIDLEDAALHHLMQTAWMIDQLQAGLPTPAAPPPPVAGTPPSTTAAASAGVAGGALSADQVAASVATPVVAGPGAAGIESNAAPGGGLVPVAAPIGAELPAPPAGLYPPAVASSPVPQQQAPPAPPLVQIVPGQLPPGSLCCPPAEPFPVDWNQPLAFLFGHTADSWRGQALAWMGAEMLALAQLPNAAAVRRAEVERSPRVDLPDPPEPWET